MIAINTVEKRKYFKKFHAEVLTSKVENQERIKSFSAIDMGKSLEGYLKQDAWEKDKEGETRVYLVKDENEKVALFFSIKCGLLYGNPQYDELDEDKKSFVDMLIDAYMRDAKDTLEDYYGAGMYEMNEVDRLFRIAEHRAKSKKEIREADEGTRTLNVEVCYSAIEIQHFCRNAEYQDEGNIGVPLGFGIFWEIIIPLIKELTNKLGCKYIYLFAADNTGCVGDDMAQTLVEYYKNDLKFTGIEDKVIIRPDYDIDCSPLFQEVQDLEKHRESVWEEFSDVV